MRRSQKRKKCRQAVSLFALLGSVHVKAAYKALMKLTPGCEMDDPNGFGLLAALCLVRLKLFP